MPYTKEGERTKNSMDTKGDLEYRVCRLMDFFMSTREFRYSDLHDCCYAVEHAAHEFRRRFLDRREDQAREKNGDVFPLMEGRFGI